MTSGHQYKTFNALPWTHNLPYAPGKYFALSDPNPHFQFYSIEKDGTTVLQTSQTRWDAERKDQTTMAKIQEFADWITKECENVE